MSYQGRKVPKKHRMSLVICRPNPNYRLTFDGTSPMFLMESVEPTDEPTYGTDRGHCQASCTCGWKETSFTRRGASKKYWEHKAMSEQPPETSQMGRLKTWLAYVERVEAGLEPRPIHPTAEVLLEDLKVPDDLVIVD